MKKKKMKLTHRIDDGPISEMMIAPDYTSRGDVIVKALQRLEAVVENNGEVFSCRNLQITFETVSLDAPKKVRQNGSL